MTLSLAYAAAGFLLLSPWGATAEDASSKLLSTHPPVADAPGDPQPGTATPDPAAPAPDYVRITENADQTLMEVNVATFTLPDQRVVDLFGVVHLGDASYYEEVNERLGKYDAVLFELVGNPDALQKPEAAAAAAAASPGPPPRPHPLRGMQKGIGNLFKLDFQLEKIDYTRPNFVHADATAEEFAKMQADRGESMMKLLLKSFQLSGDPALTEKLKDAENIGLADMVMLFYSQKTMQRIKVIFAKVLAESESIMDGGLLEKDNAIIAGRNEVALRKLEAVLQDPSKKRVAVFYGAGHMPGMEHDLKERMKATRASETWLPAWTMPAPAGKKG
jgi:hypothetical protein